MNIFIQILLLDQEKLNSDNHKLQIGKTGDFFNGLHVTKEKK